MTVSDINNATNFDQKSLINCGMKKIIILVTTLSLLGCVPLTREKVATWSDEDIRLGLTTSYRDNQFLLAEANSRNLFTSEELYSGIKEGRVFIGMSEKALFTSWGKPIRTNTHQSASGIEHQHVYGSNHYAYVKNGRVTSLSY